MQNKYFKFLLIALLIAIVAPQIALAAWWNPFSWGIWNSIFHFQQTAQRQEQQNKPPVVGGDRDAYGCIGSAGYSWCEAKQKCLRTWEEKCCIPEGWQNPTATPMDLSNCCAGLVSVQNPTGIGSICIKDE